MDFGSKSYLRGLRSKCELENIKFSIINIDNLDKNEIIKLIENQINSVNLITLVLKPINKNIIDLFRPYFKNNSLIDLENSFCYLELQGSNTSKAIMQDLEISNINLIGKNIIVFNKSETIGKPLIYNLLEEKATVISINKETNQNKINKLIEQGDIIITAANGNLSKDTIKTINNNIENFEKIIDLSDDLKSINNNKIQKYVNTINISIDTCLYLINNH